jgi:hypothetical protein
VSQELSNGIPKLRLAEEHHPIKAFGFYGSDESFCERIEIRASRRQLDALDAFSCQGVAEGLGVLRISVHDQVGLVPQESVFGISEVASHLHHPRFIGMGCDAGDVYCSGGQVDQEQHVVGDEAAERADFHTEEVGRREALPVGFQKRRPARALPSLGRGFDPVILENDSNRATAHFVAQVGHGTLDARIAQEGFSRAMRRINSA